MKTKEIFCFVMRSIVNGEELYNNVTESPELATEWRKNGEEVLNAKLVVQLPEPKITVTPSQIEELFKKFGAEKYQDVYRGQLWSHKVIAELFGENY